MSALAISALVFLLVLGGAALGAFLRAVLPKHHLSSETKDMVHVGIGLLATLAALVLGLLVASAKSSFDTKSEEVKQAATKLILLDHNLRQFGPEADAAREALRRLVVSKVDLTWVEGDPPAAGAGAAPGVPAAVRIDDIQSLVLALSPTTDAQRALQKQALRLGDDLAQTRWLLVEQTGSSIPTPFLVVLVFWLATISASLSLFAPSNGTVIAVCIVCALSVSSAIFLILEMDRPFGGLLKIPDAPLRNVIIQLAR